MSPGYCHGLRRLLLLSKIMCLPWSVCTRPWCRAIHHPGLQDLSLVPHSCPRVLIGPHLPWWDVLSRSGGALSTGGRLHVWASRLLTQLPTQAALPLHNSSSSLPSLSANLLVFCRIGRPCWYGAASCPGFGASKPRHALALCVPSRSVKD